MRVQSAVSRVVFVIGTLIFLASLSYMVLLNRQENLENSGSTVELTDQAYVESTVGNSKLLTITGTIDAINLVEKEYPIAPKQQVLTISSANNPNETYLIALGGPERGLIFSDKKLLTLREPDRIVEETLTVADLMPKIAIGNKVSIELDLTPFGSANQEYMKTLISNQHQKAKNANSKLEPVEIWYLAVGKIILEN